MNNKLILFITIISVYSCHRLEPLKSWIFRKELYHQNFYNFTDKLSLGFTNEKGYYCVAKHDISRNDSVFKIPRNLSFSVFDKFPFKSIFLKVIQSNDKVVSNN